MTKANCRHKHSEIAGTAVLTLAALALPLGFRHKHSEIAGTAVGMQEAIGRWFFSATSTLKSRGLRSTPQSPWTTPWPRHKHSEIAGTAVFRGLLGIGEGGSPPQAL